MIRITEADYISFASLRTTKSQHNILHQLTLTRIISVEMKPTAFFTEACSFHDQITNGDHVSKFKQLRRQSTCLIKLFGFFPKRSEERRVGKEYSLRFAAWWDEY